jgi:Anaphase-promoting complex subunit 1
MIGTPRLSSNPSQHINRHKLYLSNPARNYGFGIFPEFSCFFAPLSSTRLSAIGRADQQYSKRFSAQSCLSDNTRGSRTRAMNSLGPSQYRDELVIDGCSVIWTENDGLVHKRSFSFEADGQPVTHALFTMFSSSPSTVSHSPTADRSDWSPSCATGNANKALVVVLKTLMHIIYLDGGSYIVHLPFPVRKIWPVPLGLLLERHLEPAHSASSADNPLVISEPENQLPRFFTLSSPLEDFGMVSCNRSSLDLDEEIIFFSSQNDALCVTRNAPEKRITLWYATPDSQARKKVPLDRNRLTLVKSNVAAALICWYKLIQT